MTTYHKINGPFKRDHDTNKLIHGDWCMPELEYLADCEWEFTEKVDGTNIRLIIEEDGLRIGGRTERAQIPAHLYDSLKNIFLDREHEFRSAFPNGAILYGEGYGTKIQKVGSLYRPHDTSFVLFDIRCGEWWLKREDVDGIGIGLHLETIPVVGRGTLQDGFDLVRSGLTSCWGDFEAEGIVARPMVPMFSRNGQRIITKIKAKDFRENQ